MKRFYKIAEAVPVVGGFAIHLDGKPVKTPSGKILTAPNENIAAALAAEWAAQEKDIVPDLMPLTQILTTTQDRVAQDRAAMEPAVLAYLDTDLLCYRAPESNPVSMRQAALWNPWLDWFAKTYNVNLAVTEGLAALRQPDSARAAVEKTVRDLDDLRFTVLQLVVALSGSLVLGLAFMVRTATPEQVLSAARVEEDFKASIYNESLHGAAPHEEKKAAGIKRDLAAAAIILN